MGQTQLTLGHLLKKHRGMQGLTQRDLALRIDADQGTISMYEANRFLPNRDRLLSLCKILKINPDYALKVIRGEVTAPAEPLPQRGRVYANQHVTPFKLSEQVTHAVVNNANVSAAASEEPKKPHRAPPPEAPKEDPILERLRNMNPNQRAMVWHYMDFLEWKARKGSKLF